MFHFVLSLRYIKKRCLNPTNLITFYFEDEPNRSIILNKSYHFSNFFISRIANVFSC